MRVSFYAALFLITGCAAAPEKLESVARKESVRMAAPSRPFSSFVGYELKAMSFGSIQQDQAKLERARELDTKLRAKLEPLLNQWNSAPKSGAKTGRLVIEPQLADLRIVSGGARFWAGAFAGGSNVDLDLSITDGDSGQLIAKPRVALQAGGMAGGWSIGKSDSNLLDYIASVSYQYLEDHYR